MTLSINNFGTYHALLLTTDCFSSLALGRERVAVNFTNQVGVNGEEYDGI